MRNAIKICTTYIFTLIQPEKKGCVFPTKLLRYNVCSVE